MIKGIGFMFVVIFIAAVLSVGQVMYEHDKEMNITRNIYEATYNITWNSTMTQQMIYSNYTDANFLPKLMETRYSNIVVKGVDFVGYTGLEVAKMGIEFGYTHPDYNYRFFLTLAKYWIYALIIFAIVPVIIPVMALFTILFMTIRDLVVKLKKKREMKNVQH